MAIHATAVVEDGATLGAGVEIGACVDMVSGASVEDWAAVSIADAVVGAGVEACVAATRLTSSS